MRATAAHHAQLQVGRTGRRIVQVEVAIVRLERDLESSVTQVCNGRTCSRHHAEARIGGTRGGIVQVEVAASACLEGHLVPTDGVTGDAGTGVVHDAERRVDGTTGRVI